MSLITVIAEALWCVGQGYTFEDKEAMGGVTWSPLNADDVQEEALYKGLALEVLVHLRKAGWTPTV